MKESKIIFVFLVFFMGCSSPTPSDVLPQEKMVAVLKDIHLGEQKTALLRLGSNDSSVVVYREIERRIFEKYEIDSTVYRKSYDYYARNPALFKEMYQIVVDSLDAEDKRTKSGGSNNYKPDPTRPI